jgi:glycosyltransferase involved in cell wall biosynthesis
MIHPSLNQKFIDLKICVIIPTYNNDQTLENVLNSVLEYTSNVIVVNDGSTDSTPKILDNQPNIQLISYIENKGKGFALRAGFKKAISLGYEYAITIDSDGQHFAKDLPLFIEKLEEVGPCLIIGSRNMNQDFIPGKSSFGNKFSNFWFWAETGIRMPDTQSGYRLYPIALMKNIFFITRKFEFEIESIVRTAWKGVKFETVPVSVYYAPPTERVTHFRPFQDFSRISVLNTFLFFFAILIIHPLRFLKHIFSISTYKNYLEEIKNSQHSRLITSISVGFGIFMGIFPIWGFQLIVGIFLALIFRLNKALVIIFANISIPPMIPLIIFLSYKMGSFWMGDQAVDIDFSKDISIDTIKLNLKQYVLGSINLAIVASLIFGTAAYGFLTLYKNSADNE